MTKKVKVKIATVSADRDLIVANALQINLMEVMTCELSPVPYALAHQDGTLRKNSKCQLASIIEKQVNVVPRLQVPPEKTVYILDGMAIVQMTFGELADIFSSPLSTRKCYCIHVVFDQYFEISIKLVSGQREANQVHWRYTLEELPRQYQSSGPNTSPTI